MYPRLTSPLLSAPQNVFGVLSVIGAAALWARPDNLARVLSASAFSALIAYGLSRLERRFLYTDYIHATR
jgi:hypothetical protein